MARKVETMICPSCGHYACKMVVEDYNLKLVNGHFLIIPDLQFYRCVKCKEETIPASSCKRVNDAIQEYFNKGII